ncbi:hypothetical protein [Wukongibacter sp. M2B1]|uniref:hypothetical protein n=1 Tax=Wukongibacter sp. M2B1 TaxID=3088895 RepID=UPI003D7B8FA2
MKIKYLIVLICIILFLCGCNNNASIKPSYSNDKENGNSTPENNNMKINTTESIAKSNIHNKREEIQNRKDKKSSGLLFGLKRTTKNDHEPTEYETIWIAQDNENIIVRRGKGFLSVPYGEVFYKIQNSIYDNKKFSTEADDRSDSASIYNYEYKFHFIDTVAYPFEDKPNEVYYGDISWGDGEWPFRTTKDEVLFVGNKYILINKDYYETGGGTYRASWYSNSLYELKYLGKEYKKNTVDLNNFFDIDKEKLNNYKNDYNMDLNNDDELKGFITHKQGVSTKNPLVTRKNGHWVVALPLEETYTHGGNGSTHTIAKDFLEITDQVSNQLLCYDDLIIPFETIKKQIPEARDAVSSPNGSMLAVLVKDRINIYLYKAKTDQLKEPDYSIRISAEQSVVSNQWATNKYVETWDNTLKKYLTTDKIK